MERSSPRTTETAATLPRMPRPTPLVAGALLAAVVAIAACGGGGAASEAPNAEEPTNTGDPTAAPIARTPAPDCTPARTHAAGASNEEAAGPDGAIGFVVHTPPSYDGAAPMAVVLNYHGAGGTPEGQIAYSQLAVTAEEHGFLLVAPPVGSDASAVLDHVEAGWCVDTARVFATGMSAGARVSSRLVCELPERIAAIAPVAGLDYPERLCEDAPPRPVIAFHGSADQIIVMQGVRDATLAWGRHNGCDPPPVPDPVSERVFLASYTNCEAGADVELYTVEGGGHTWPGAEPREGGPLGATTDEISANELMWAFFEAHPLR